MSESPIRHADVGGCAILAILDGHGHFVAPRVAWDAVVTHVVARARFHWLDRNRGRARMGWGRTETQRENSLKKSILLLSYVRSELSIEFAPS